MTNFKQQGFALLYAVLLTSIVLTVGLGLSSILRKQIILSSTGAASQQAYYAANTIKECVLHWGLWGGLDESGNNTSVFGGWKRNLEGTGYDFVEPNDNQIYCAGDEAITVDSPSGLGDDPRVFVIDNIDIDGACSSVKVTLVPGNSEVIATGYNVSCDNTDNPRRIERQIVGGGNFTVPF